MHQISIYFESNFLQQKPFKNAQIFTSQNNKNMMEMINSESNGSKTSKDVKPSTGGDAERTKWFDEMLTGKPP